MNDPILYESYFFAIGDISRVMRREGYYYPVLALDHESYNKTSLELRYYPWRMPPIVDEGYESTPQAFDRFKELLLVSPYPFDTTDLDEQQRLSMCRPERSKWDSVLLTFYGTPLWNELKTLAYQHYEAALAILFFTDSFSAYKRVDIVRDNFKTLVEVCRSFNPELFSPQEMSQIRLAFEDCFIDYKVALDTFLPIELPIV